jgi:hypothetical protein
VQCSVESTGVWYAERQDSMGGVQQRGNVIENSTNRLEVRVRSWLEI